MKGEKLALKELVEPTMLMRQKFDAVRIIIQDNIVQMFHLLEQQLMSPDPNFDNDSKFFWKMILLYIITSNQIEFLSELEQQPSMHQFSTGSCAACPTDGDEQQKVFDLSCGHKLHQRCANKMIQNKSDMFGSGSITCPLCRNVQQISYPLPPIWKKCLFDLINLYKMSHPMIDS